MRLVHHHLLATVEKYPEKTAIVCDNRNVSYAMLLRKMDTFTSRLADAGLRKGDRALILLHDKADFLTACYSVIASGAIAVPVSEEVATATIEHVARDCDARLLITSLLELSNYPLLRDRLSCTILSMQHTNGESYIQQSKESSSTGRNRSVVSSLRDVMREVRDDEGAMILYTSGISGRKKGVFLSHRNLIQSTQNIVEFMKIDETICEFIVPPLEHSFGFGRSRCVFFVGGTLVVNNGMLNPNAFIQNIMAHECNAISSVPAGFGTFMGRLEPLLHKIGPQIRWIEVGSSFMPLDHKLKLLQIFPYANICMHYGLTEASRSTFLDFRREQRKLNTVGKPSPRVEVDVLDEEGRKLEPMQMGELVVRGEHVAIGYWENKGVSHEGFVGNNSFRTGDFGYIDEEGYVNLLGRKDDIINMGGIKISLLEVEEKISEAYPDCDICVVGVPDSLGILGEIPVLCYTSRDGRTITPSELSAALSHRLDRDKIPRIVYRIESIPKTENAKVMRRELRRKLVEGTAHHIEQVA